tara:strand:+ start:804 stop:974 length:171 start_codon:yes stop_codon:yes gene_type:complete
MSKVKNTSDRPDGRYKLETVSIKEIIEKYPDKVVEAIDRKRDTILVLDTCKIRFMK